MLSNPESRHSPFEGMLVTVLIVVCSLGAAMLAERSSKEASLALASCALFQTTATGSNSLRELLYAGCNESFQTAGVHR